MQKTITMKILFTGIAAMLLLATQTFAQVPAVIKDTAPNNKAGEIVFEHDIYDFGTVAYGERAVHEFVFTNKGKEPLVISDVKAQCSCTTPTWSKAAVAPGKTGSIVVEYDTKRPGMVEKRITIISNAKNSTKEISVKINVTDPSHPATPGNNVDAPGPPGE